MNRKKDGPGTSRRTVTQMKERKKKTSRATTTEVGEARASCASPGGFPCRVYFVTRCRGWSELEINSGSGSHFRSSPGPWGLCLRPASGDLASWGGGREAGSSGMVGKRRPGSAMAAAFEAFGGNGKAGSLLRVVEVPDSLVGLRYSGTFFLLLMKCHLGSVQWPCDGRIWTNRDAVTPRPATSGAFTLTLTVDNDARTHPGHDGGNVAETGEKKRQNCPGECDKPASQPATAFGSGVCARNGFWPTG